MKISILSFYSGHIDRGVERWVEEIATRLAKRNDVLVFQGGDKKTKGYKSRIIRVCMFGKPRSEEKYLSKLLMDVYWGFLNCIFSLKLLRSLILFKPDIVMPTNGGVQTLIIKMFSQFFSWKVVITGHAGIGAPDKWNILLRPDIFVSPSKRGAVWAKKLFFSKGIRIEQISHGVDLKKFSSKVKMIDIKLERPIILCVSSFDSYKRVDLAIKAVSKLDKGNLLVIGGDREQRKIDSLVHKLLGKNRYLKTRVKPNEIPKYYASSDIFTLPSTENEAFGMVYLEALASGLPVVATDDELRREIVGDAGILVDPTDIDSYAKALEEVLEIDWENKPRTQAEKFSWEKVVEKYENLFEELVQENKEIQA